MRCLKCRKLHFLWSSDADPVERTHSVSVHPLAGFIKLPSQKRRLYATALSICLFVRLSVAFVSWNRMQLPPPRVSHVSFPHQIFTPMKFVLVAGLTYGAHKRATLDGATLPQERWDEKGWEKWGRDGKGGSYFVACLRPGADDRNSNSFLLAFNLLTAETMSSEVIT